MIFHFYAGTPSWLAPETITDPYTDKADIFSLATTLWELMAWKMPFDNTPDREKVLKMILFGKRETIPESCPQNIAKLITLGWMQAPAKRPSANEMLKQLDAIKLAIPFNG
jgi:serine/threonine protein kinase